MPDVDVTLIKTVTRHRDSDCRPNCRMNMFPRVCSEHSLFPLLSLMTPLVPFATIQISRSAHSWVQAIRLTFKPGTTKTGIEILGDLNGLIQVAVNFSLLPKYTEIDETRHVVPSRSSGFPVMRLVAPLSRIRLSLRSWSMILMI